MKFTVRWERWGYDEFDTIDSIIEEGPFEVIADTVEAGKALAEHQAYEQTAEERRRLGYTTSFTVVVLSLTDEHGIVHRFNKRSRIVIEYQIESYDD